MGPLPSLLSALLGCVEPSCTTDCVSDSGGDTADAVEGDSGVAPYVAEEPTPDWSIEEVREQIFGAFATGLPHAGTLRNTYLTMMAEGDADCVGSATIITQDYILGCVADSRYYYSGVCVYDEASFAEGSGSSTTWGLGGDFELAYPDGRRFAAGGGATWNGFRANNGDERFSSNIRGTWLDESQTNWLGEGLSALFDITGGVSDGKSHVTVDGGVAIGATDLYFDAMTWDWGGACAGAPVGDLRLRDPRGYWYIWSLEDDCDTCGDVVFHGDTLLGELCVDLTPVGEDAYRGNAVPE